MESFAPVSPTVEKTASRCIDCAMQVHRHLGPGFREIVYHRAFCLELDSQGIPFETEKPILVKYKSWQIPGQKLDLLVDGLVLVEIKAVPKIRRIHHSQVASYLRTLDLRLGLILNFQARLMKDGIKRVVL